MYVEFDYNADQETRDLINGCLWVLPDWVHEVCVVLDKDDQANNARCRVDWEYASITLILCTAFFRAPDKDRIVVHEFCHAYTSPISEVSYQVSSTLKHDGERRAYDGITDKVLEMSTCALQRKLQEIAGRGGK